MPHRKGILSKERLFVNKKLLLIVTVFLLASFFLGTGIIIGGNLLSRPPMVIDTELLIIPDTSPSHEQTPLNQSSLPFVASKRGQYYYPVNCSLSQGLSEKNKIYFASEAEAEAEGYRYNQRCSGSN